MKLNKSQERKIGVVLSYTQMALSIVTALVYTPFMLRTMGQAEYGLYGTVTSATNLIGILDLGFNSAYVKFYSVYKSKNDEKAIQSFNSLFFLVFSIISAVALCIGLFFTFNLNLIFDEGLTSAEYEKARILMSLLTFSLALGFMTTIFGSFISVNEKFFFFKSFTLGTTILTVGLNVLVLILGYGSVGLVCVTISISILTKIVEIIYCFKKLNLKFGKITHGKDTFKDMVSFSVFIAINLVVDKINVGIDSVLLGRFCGTVSVACYSVGSSLSGHFTNFSTAISGIFVPHVHQIVNSYEQDSQEQRDALTAFFTKVGRIQNLLMMLIASGFVFFGRKFILFWAGDGYSDAYIVALLLMIPSIVPLIQNVGIEIQRAENRHHYRSYIYGSMALLNLIISIFLCQIWEGVGAALGTAIATVVANGIIMNIVYHKKINIDIIVFWKSILTQLKGMIIPFIAGALIMLFVPINGWASLIAMIFVYIIIYAVFIWLFSLNDYEKNLTKSILRKIKIIK